MARGSPPAVRGPAGDGSSRRTREQLRLRAEAEVVGWRGAVAGRGGGGARGREG